MLSVDVLRGLTILLMILVNDPGDPGCVYPPLEHAEWNGYTPADLIFPNFLFLAGVSLIFSLQSRVECARLGDGSRWELARGLGRRAVNLLLLKLVVSALPTFRLRPFRIFGVLFRTAACSLAAGLILLGTTSLPRLLSIVAAMLGTYWLALRIPFGTLNQPLLDPDNNVAAALDRAISRGFHRLVDTGTLWNVTHDPEGLLSTVPAVATVLLGTSAALVLRDKRLSSEAKCGVLAGAGAVSLAAGHLWDRSFPINKNLWTSSYVLSSAGWSSLALAGFYWLYDLQGVGERSRVVEAVTRPLQIFGANALVAYAVSVLGHKTSRTFHLHTTDGHFLSVRTYAYRRTFARSRSSRARSLGFALTYAALVFLPNLFLWKRKILVKL